MDINIIKYSFNWDFRTWSKALNVWKVTKTEKSKKVLELGGADNEGLSLYFSSLNYNTTFSSIDKPSEEVKTKHKKWKCHNLINYKQIDALDIQYKNEFDIICFKSILGGIARDDLSMAEKVISECHTALKPGGFLLCCENLSGSIFHQFARRLFSRAHKNAWHYYNPKEILDIIKKQFPDIEYECYGFLTLFTRNNYFSSILHFIDNYLLNFILPENSKYIIAIKATKKIYK